MKKKISSKQLKDNDLDKLSPEQRRRYIVG
jgi:hypothetical protein